LSSLGSLLGTPSSFYKEICPVRARFTSQSVRYIERLVVKAYATTPSPSKILGLPRARPLYPQSSVPQPELGFPVRLVEKSVFYQIQHPRLLLRLHPSPLFLESRQAREGGDPIPRSRSRGPGSTSFSGSTFAREVVLSSIMTPNLFLSHDFVSEGGRWFKGTLECRTRTHL